MTSNPISIIPHLTEDFSKLAMTSTQSEVGFQGLPTHVKPLNYSLHITPSFTSRDFKVIEYIDVLVKNSTSQITLNSIDLVINKISYEALGKAGSGSYTSTFATYPETETLVISFDKPLPTGEGKLTIQHSGRINEEHKGIFTYKNNYKTKDVESFGYGLTMATHFDQSYARRVFPCWDEPCIKATFDINLEVPSSLFAFSNMPMANECPTVHGKKVVKFARSPPMPTFLVAFAIGEFDGTTVELDDGFKCSTHTSPGNSQKAKFALDVAVKLIPFFNKYFGHRCPLPKVDIVALQEFSGNAGMMENWGLIFFNENKLLIHDKVTSSRTKQDVAQLVSRQLSHQWFGNVITTDWNEMYLREGIALFFEYLGLDFAFPEYGGWSQFTINTAVKALELDAMLESHPIAVPPHDHSKVLETFDALAYAKGGALIRMLHNYLTDDVFRSGLSIFINRYRFKTMRAEDLWGIFEEISSKPIIAMMNTWTSQKGFPLIIVCCDEKEVTCRTLTISQQKFYSQPEYTKGVTDFDIHRWILPITVSSSEKSSSCVEVLMDGTQDRFVKFTVDGVSNNAWVKINSGFQGLFRVHYPQDTILEFLPAIQNKSMPPMDRLELLDDMYSMVRSGDVRTVQMLEFLRSYSMEDDFSVWCAIDNIVGMLNNILSFTDVHVKFQNYAKKEIFKHVEDKVGWELKPEDGHLGSLLRVHILARLVSLGSENALRVAREKFVNRFDIPISPDLRSVVYRAILKATSNHTSIEAFETLLKMYEETSVQEEKLRILRALGSVNTPALRNRVLNFAMSGQIKPDHALLLIIGMCTSKAGIECAWEFFKENFKVFRARYSVGPLFTRFITAITSGFSSIRKANEVEQFFKDNPFEGLNKTVQQILDQIRVNEDWMERDLESLRTFLTKV